MAEASPTRLGPSCRPSNVSQKMKMKTPISAATLPSSKAYDKPAVHLPDGRGRSRGGAVVLVVHVVIVLGLDVGDRSEEEDDRQDEDPHRHARVRNPERLGAGAPTGGVRAVEEHAAGDGTEDPADAVAGLGRVDARGGVARRPEHRGVGIGHRLQEGQAGGHDAHAEEKGPERRDLRGRMNQKPPTATSSSPAMMPPL